MAATQELIHKLEVGGGMRYFRWSLLVLALLLVIVGYNARQFKNMSTLEAMDSAQLARNLAEGKGYTTFFVRPFSMFLVKRHNLKNPGSESAKTDLAEIKGRHPDLANPPVYPVALAALMKVLPFDYTASTASPFWSSGGKFLRYQPDFIINAFNQLLFLGVVVLVFFLARRLFDGHIAWLSAIVVFGTELFWRFSVSGLSTLLLMLLFLGLVWCLVLLEEELREPRHGAAGLLILAVAAGILTGLGGLTRYSFGWLILPVLAFLLVFSGRQRWLLAGLALVAFAVVLTPWICRNYSVSGTPFGTAGYSLIESSGSFPDFRLERSLEPDLTRISLLSLFWGKLLPNLHLILLNDLPKLAGSWITAFFLVGLLVRSHHPSATRLRYFLVGCLILLAVIQALGRTHLSEESPEINSENLLVLLAPLVLIYGVGYFYTLFDEIELPFRELRHVGLGAFGVVVCLPMLFAFLPPKPSPIAYPPYYPPFIQLNAGWVRDNELAASDMPWAIAWYGQRQCLWANNPADFLAVNDFQKPVQALMLTSLTLGKTDSFALTQGAFVLDQSWATFFMQGLSAIQRFKYPMQDSRNWPVQLSFAVRQGTTPVTFPLHYWQPGWPDIFVLTAEEQQPKSQ
jgi:hypothetical protein